MRLHPDGARHFAPFILILGLLFTSSSCKSPLVPPDNWTPSGPDTTSHAFFWEIDTIGVSGILYDVAIINDTLAYAVGEIYLNDSTGQIDPTRYNMAQWNGQSWIVSRLQFPQYNFDCTVAGYSPGAIRSVFAFGPGNVLFTDGLSIARWNGSAFEHLPCLSLSIIGTGRFLKIWGISQEDFYCVGTEGAIFHFNGTGWQKIESGTTLDLYDIWGTESPLAGKVEILSAGGKRFVNLERVILAIDNSSATILSDSGITQPLNGIWFVPEESYVTVGSGIYRKSSLDDTLWTGQPGEITTFYSNAVRGTAPNNVFVVGSFGDVLHFNGSSWQDYPELTTAADSYFGVAVAGRIVMAVGDGGSGAVVVRATIP